MEETVRILQDRVNTALLGSAWRTLNELIAPDARIIGPRGFIIDRDTWIGVPKDSKYQQVRLEPTETDAAPTTTPASGSTSSSPNANTRAKPSPAGSGLPSSGSPTTGVGSSPRSSTRPFVTGDTTTPIRTARPGARYAPHRTSQPSSTARSGRGRRTNANRDQLDPP